MVLGRVSGREESESGQWNCFGIGRSIYFYNSKIDEESDWVDSSLYEREESESRNNLRSMHNIDLFQQSSTRLHNRQNAEDLLWEKEPQWSPQQEIS